jgi:hypothetical protein
VTAIASLPYATLATAEIRRRAAEMPREITSWVKQADTNFQGLGIHSSQVAALKVMVEALIERQSAAVNALDPGVPPAQFAELYLDCLDEIAGTQGVWSLFRSALGQRNIRDLGAALDLADLVAADCYQTCQNQANAWGLLKEEEFRAPPLVYLNSEPDVWTVRRGGRVQSLTPQELRYGDSRLPIPVVVLPFDTASSVWTFCVLHHEVGHNIDQDLGLVSELRQHLVPALEACNPPVPQSRSMLWHQWEREILADAFGLLLGGTGFVRYAASFFLTRAPAADYQQLNQKSEHPPHALRVLILASLARGCQLSELTSLADEVSAEATGVLPAWAGEFRQDIETVVRVTMLQALQSLGNRRVLELVPNLAGDLSRANDLAASLLNEKSPPAVTNPTFPVRLVPAAAQIAFGRSGTDALLSAIHTQALNFSTRIPRPRKLAGSYAQSQFFRKLTMDLRFNTES